jgi:hypothetical protein
MKTAMKTAAYVSPFFPCLPFGADLCRSLFLPTVARVPPNEPSRPFHVISAGELLLITLAGFPADLERKLHLRFGLLPLPFFGVCLST